MRNRRITANRDRAATSPPRAAGITPAAGAAAEEVSDDPDRPSDHLGLHHRLCRVCLRRDGRFRSRSRILFPLFPKKADRDVIMKQRGAGLGRQRNLAGARGGGMMGVPLAYAVLMPALYTPMMRCCSAWYSVASPLNSAGAPRANVTAGYCVRRRLAAGDAGAGHRTRRHPARHPCRWPALCRGWWDWLTPFSILTGVALRLAMRCWEPPGW